eukprot:scaffold59739_cov71-Phaeocystis_antarctica.AAC.6
MLTCAPRRRPEGWRYEVRGGRLECRGGADLGQRAELQVAVVDHVVQRVVVEVGHLGRVEGALLRLVEVLDQLGPPAAQYARCLTMLHALWLYSPSWLYLLWHLYIMLAVSLFDGPRRAATAAGAPASSSLASTPASATCTAASTEVTAGVGAPGGARGGELSGTSLQRCLSSSR